MMSLFYIADKCRQMLPCLIVSSLILSGCGGSDSSTGGTASSQAVSSHLSSTVSSSVVSSITSSSSQVSSSQPSSSLVSSTVGMLSSMGVSSSLLSSLASSFHSTSLASSVASSRNSSTTGGITHISEKRGLAYGYHSPNDLAAMQGKVKWWYNWAVTPEAAVASQYLNYGFEFVPMAWNGNFNETALRTYLSNHPEVKYLLGFNEPNFAEQANLTPQQAADLWPTLEAIADDYDLKLVAPAVNYSPGNVDIPGTNDDWSPWKYLDAFFEACDGCRVDYIAVHCYMKYSSAFEWFIGEFERYNKPIWVTEWASWDEGGPANVGEQMNYLASTVRWLEANEKVYRYSWFIGRTSEGASAHPYIDILAGNGVLTPLGGLYTAIPSSNYRYSAPGKFEAEGAHTQSGFTHRATTDSSGYVDLVSANNSWTEYKIYVDESGSYQFDFRVISANAGRKIDILVDSAALVSVDLNQSNSWQTVTASGNLTTGDHTLRIEADQANVIVNWIEISKP